MTEEATQTIAVEVEADHLTRLASARRPALALAELIWNALDADATVVRVEIDRNAMGSIATIRVVDNGAGMPRDGIAEYFRKLGGSWKKLRTRTDGKRVLHGKQGEGRFRAFALGSHVQWLTRHHGEDGTDTETIVVGTRAAIARFEIRAASGQMLAAPGTTVTISNVPLKLPGLAAGPSAGLVDELTEHFALYMIQYPGITVTLDGTAIDPSGAMHDRTEYTLSVDVPGGGTIQPRLTIIEWERDAERALCLCDDEGFSLLNLKMAARLPGYSFSAYLRSPLVRSLHETNELSLEEQHPAVAALADAARAQVREHFRQRRAADARGRVQHWKTEKVYPFAGDAVSKMDVVERQVFEVCAANVEMLAPEFEKADVRTKALTFRLLRQAIEKSPAEVQKILGEVLDLPAQKQKALAKLLHRTTLSAIINASSVIADRLEFLQGLEAVLFDPQTKGLLKERTQLHRILEKNTWIFGEEFHLTVSDQGLTKVLMKHIEMKTGTKPTKIAPVKTSTGNPQIVDLFLSRRVPLPREEERQHLIVELKRPSVEIDSDVLTQVKKYATSAAGDERFRDSHVRWTFWALSNGMDDVARAEANQKDRESGVVWRDGGKIPLTIWAKTWGQLLDECRGRLEFFRAKLEYQADHESGRAYLKEVYDKFLPSIGGNGSGDAAIDAAQDGAADPSSDQDDPASDDGAFAIDGAGEPSAATGKTDPAT